MAVVTTDLESRLQDWARVWGGGIYGIGGGSSSPLGSMIKWGGRAPSGLGHMPETPLADEVNQVVSDLMRSARGRTPAAVLKCEYFHLGWALEHKLDDLRARSVELGRTTYYKNLRIARDHVRDALGLIDHEKQAVYEL